MKDKNLKDKNLKVICEDSGVFQNTFSIMSNITNVVTSKPLARSLMRARMRFNERAARLTPEWKKRLTWSLTYYADWVCGCTAFGFCSGGVYWCQTCFIDVKNAKNVFGDFQADYMFSCVLTGSSFVAHVAWGGIVYGLASATVPVSFPLYLWLRSRKIAQENAEKRREKEHFPFTYR